MAGTPQRGDGSWQDQGGEHPSSRGSWASAAAGSRGTSGDFGGGGGGIAEEVEAELMGLLDRCGQDTQLLGRFNKELNEVADAVDDQLRSVRGMGTLAALPLSPFGSSFASGFVRRDPHGRAVCMLDNGGRAQTWIGARPVLILYHV